MSWCYKENKGDADDFLKISIFVRWEKVEEAKLGNKMDENRCFGGENDTIGNRYHCQRTHQIVQLVFSFEYKCYIWI